jgi:hypothetical protein
MSGLLVCETIGCGRRADTIGNSGRLLCARCFEELYLALPHVTWRERWRAARARETVTPDEAVERALGDDLEQISNGGLIPTSWVRRWVWREKREGS